MIDISIIYADDAGGVHRHPTSLPTITTEVLEHFVDQFEHVILTIHAGEQCLYRSAAQPSDFSW